MHLAPIRVSRHSVTRATSCVSSPMCVPLWMIDPGPTLEEHLQALTITLSAEDHAELDRLFPRGGAVSPFFDRDLSPHVYR